MAKTTAASGNRKFPNENNSLQFVNTNEGRARLESGTWKYDYFLKDHLGNVRMMIADDGAVLEETHYYPFGLQQKGISTRASGNLHNKEKTFQNQRFDDDLDLNWVQFKYRNHDPQIGRFIEIDPLANDYVHNSTYAFSENKVTNHVELEGLEAISAEILREVQRVSTQAGPYGKAIVIGGGIAAGLVWLGEKIIQGMEAGGSNNSVTLIPESIRSPVRLNTEGSEVKKGDYSHLQEPKNVQPGAKTTPAQRKRILEENKKQNNGELRSDGDGRRLNPPKANKKGEKADPNQAEVDHKTSRANGGSNSNANQRVVSKEENLKKGKNDL